MGHDTERSSSYFILGCFGPRDADRTTIGTIVNTKVSWQSGRRFSEPPPQPVLVDLDPQFPGVMVPMFDAGILLFTDAMLSAIHRAGVDNLDIYAAIIRDPLTGKTYHEYKAVNVIGTIAAADLARSEWAAPSGSPIVDTDFDSLALDESRIGGALMFRLAENVTAIVIHDTVRRELEAAKIPYLDFHEPKNWMG
jgi:hypothetical protein